MYHYKPGVDFHASCSHEDPNAKISFSFNYIILTVTEKKKQIVTHMRPHYMESMNFELC